MPVIYVDKDKSLASRDFIFPIILGTAFVILFLRLWYIQVVKSEEYSERALAFHQTVLHRDAPRGLIVDRYGQLLAGVKSELVITAQPAIVKQNPELLLKVAKILNQPLNKLQRKLNDAYRNPYQPTPIYLSPPIDIATKIAEESRSLPGFGVDTIPMRYYTEHHAFSHLLGYVWTPNPKEVDFFLKKNFNVPTYVGKAGLEKQYELQLMGVPGNEVMEADVHRRPIKVIARDHAIPGDRLRLTIDMELQKKASELLKGYRGAVVAIEPKTGDILCLVSSPTYDNALFTHGISNTDWRALLENKEFPLLNRAIAGLYPPASTNKILIAMTAMRLNQFNPNETFLCRGYYQWNKHRVKCLGNHGMVSFDRALAKSCNAYFATLGMRVGIDAIRDTCHMMHLGKQTGVDISSEKKGVVPTLEWIKKWRKPAIWYPGDTVNIAIGQGDITITPLQNAQIIAAIANRGIAYRPHLIKARYPAGTRDKSGVIQKREKVFQFDLSQRNWDILHRALVNVVEYGTVMRGKIPGLKWAAKTGSAEHGKDKEAIRRTKTHSWVIGYAPAENPKIAIAVVMETVGHGSHFAAPVATAIIKHHLNIK